MKWVSETEALPKIGQVVLLAHPRQADDVWDIRTAQLLVHHEGVVPRPVQKGDRWPSNYYWEVNRGGSAQSHPILVTGNSWWALLRRVLSVMKALGINKSRLRFHRGWFHETFSKSDIENIALLHVDGDFYESIRLTLEHWLPRMSIGGIVQIDDYSAFVGCRKAVDEVLSSHPRLCLEYFRENYADVFYIRIPNRTDTT